LVKKRKKSSLKELQSLLGKLHFIEDGKEGGREVVRRRMER
jgi:hypothetical protein